MESKCNKCGESIESGLFNWLDHVNKCEGNKVNYSDKITKQDLEEFIDYIYNKPRVYYGQTICGKQYTSDKYMPISPCNDSTCEPCKEYEELLIKVYIKDEKK